MSPRNNTEEVRNITNKCLNIPVFKHSRLPYEIKHRMAFTLAEVLVTLVIIGIVASLTIPGLIASTNKAQYAIKLQKIHGVLIQAFNLIVLDNGGSILNDPNFNCSGATCTNTESANAMNEFAAKLKVIKNCGNATGCFYASPVKFLDGTTAYSNNIDNDWSGARGKAILADGTSMMVVIIGNSCTQNYGSNGTPFTNSVCGTIQIDVNGAAGPNIYGRDFFAFRITQTGIFPTGAFGDGTCDIASNTESSSVGCTAKVLVERAMNY